MNYLILGIILWVAIHVLKRVAPSVRSAMDAKFGAGPAKGIIAAGLLLSLILMIIGYRAADVTAVYTPMAGAGHANNLLMLISVMLFGMSASKGRLGSLLRHPMLTGVTVWGVAHLLVNSDKASLILFGSMIVWALAEMALINRAEGRWTRPAAGPASGDIKLIIITLVMFSIIAGIHIALGKNPFLGTY